MSMISLIIIKQKEKKKHNYVGVGDMTKILYHDMTNSISR